MGGFQITVQHFFKDEAGPVWKGRTGRVCFSPTAQSNPSAKQKTAIIGFMDRWPVELHSL
jgi:hypothetical protein